MKTYPAHRNEEKIILGFRDIMQDQSRKYSRPRTANRGEPLGPGHFSPSPSLSLGQKNLLLLLSRLIYSGLSGDWSKMQLQLPGLHERLTACGFPFPSTHTAGEEAKAEQG